MRTREEVQLVDELVAQGLNDCEIARRTGIPRGTVRDWRNGRRPNLETKQLFGDDEHPALPRAIERSYAYLLGLYLGDGHITRMPRTWRIRVALDGAYPDIVAECRTAIEEVFRRPTAVVSTKSRAVVVNAYSNEIPRLFPQHGPGMKHHRRIELAAWQRSITQRQPEALIRGLIHSDGSRGPNTVCVNGKTYRYPRYYFCNYSDDIRRIFCDHLDLIGIPWRRMNRFNISVARRDGVARLDEFVGPKS